MLTSRQAAYEVSPMFPVRSVTYVPGLYRSLLLTAGAPITYVSAQLGHANPTTTLRYYARWIPGQGQRWDILLDRFGSKLEPKMEPNGVSREWTIRNRWRELAPRAGLEPAT